MHFKLDTSTELFLQNFADAYSKEKVSRITFLSSAVQMFSYRFFQNPNISLKLKL